jgi:hypothetical protein
VAVKGVVLEHFHRINDLAGPGKSNVVWTYNRYGIPWEEGQKPESMAMRLFVDHPEAFKCAYALYSWYNCPGRMSEYRMPTQAFEVTDARLNKFREEIRDWFRRLAKGDVTNVEVYERDGVTVILVTHGSYVRTVAEWQGDEVTIRSFRPATEDILLYDPEEKVLRIKATLAKDRTQYVQSFAGHVLEDVSVVDEAQEQPAYTLEPFQTGKFDFGGNEEITQVVLLEARVELGGETEPRVQLKSADLCRSLDEDLKHFSLAMGDLTYVKLRFHLAANGKETHENVEIAPPERSDLPGARHQEVISQYLEAQGVKLI